MEWACDRKQTIIESEAHRARIASSDTPVHPELPFSSAQTRLDCCNVQQPFHAVRAILGVGCLVLRLGEGSAAERASSRVIVVVALDWTAFKNLQAMRVSSRSQP
eukprot:1707674-Rhodomonas_salina.4